MHLLKKDLTILFSIFKIFLNSILPITVRRPMIPVVSATLSFLFYCQEWYLLFHCLAIYHKFQAFFFVIRASSLCYIVFSNSFIFSCVALLLYFVTLSDLFQSPVLLLLALLLVSLSCHPRIRLILCQYA